MGVQVGWVCSITSSFDGAWVFTSTHHLRQYPKGLGRALLKLVKSKEFQKKQPCLRQKKVLSEFTDELSLFKSLPMGDTWTDARLADVYVYLWSNRKLNIPSLWLSTMKTFTQDLKRVPQRTLVLTVRYFVLLIVFSMPLTSHPRCMIQTLLAWMTYD